MGSQFLHPRVCDLRNAEVEVGEALQTRGPCQRRGALIPEMVVLQLEGGELAQVSGAGQSSIAVGIQRISARIIPR